METSNVDTVSASATSTDTSSSDVVTRKRSAYWKHVISNSDGTFSCKYCSQIFSKSANTSNFQRHIKFNHQDKLESVTLSAPTVTFNPEVTTKKFVKWIVCDLQPF